MLRTIITSACAAVLVSAVAPTPARGQSTLDSRTEFTFNQPVELPGVTLPPGTYVFRIADATTARNVLQVQAKDASNKTYGMFITISAQRPTPADDAELRFLESPAGQPAAVKTWWYPGHTIGREFIYPRSQAQKLAQATNQNVLTTRADVSGDAVKAADLSYVSPSGQDMPLSDEQLVDRAANTPPEGTVNATAAQQEMANRPSPPQANQSATQGARATAGQAQDDAAAAPGRTQLPRTSTPFGAFALMGLISLAGAAALRLRR